MRSLMATPQDNQVASGHSCPIHHIAHDYYGMRLATCSSDKTIRVFEKTDGKWILISQWNAHKGIIWKVAWAHPEFGQVLASCSDDRTIMIWSEVSSASGVEPKVTFQLLQTLTEFEKGVHCLAFAPSHMGLLLASGCNDGKVRVHAGSATKPEEWRVQSEFAPDPDQPAAYISGLSWNKNRGDCAMVAVGWWAGTDPLLSSVAVWGFIAERKEWQPVTRLEVETDKRGVTAEVRDVGWANSCGRPTHCIAAAVGSTVQVWRLPSLSGWPIRKLQPVVTLRLPDAPGPRPFWHVSWSATGSALSASAEDGSVVVWRLDPSGQLQLHSTLHPDARQPLLPD